MAAAAQTSSDPTSHRDRSTSPARPRVRCSPPATSPGRCAASRTRSSSATRVPTTSSCSASRRRGVPLAQRLGGRDRARSRARTVPVGSLDITMHRDDLRHQPVRAAGPHRHPAGGIDDKVVVLVDDVLFSGRTIRAALDALAELGRPRAVRLAVLVDRGHRELPDPRRPRRARTCRRPPRRRVRVHLDRGRRRHDVGADHRRVRPDEPAPAVRRPTSAATTSRPSSPPPSRCTTCSSRDVKKMPTLRGRTVINLFFEDSTRTRSSLRDRRQVDVRRHHQHHRQGLLDEQGRVACATPSARSTPWPSTPSSSGTTRRGACHQVAQWVDASVINAGDGTHEHPTQALLDAYTLRNAARRPRRPARRHRRRPDPPPGLPLQRRSPSSRSARTSPSSRRRP